MAVQIPNITYTCQDLGGSALMDCSFRLLDCKATSTKGIFANCGQLWNDTLCQTDFCYQAPVPRGSRFMLQTQFPDFYSDDPTAPIAGWGDWVLLELYNAATGLLVTDVLTNISGRHGVGYSAGQSFQTVEIDTGLAVFNSVDTFYLKISVLDADLNVFDSVCTQHYVFPDSCTNLVKLSSRYPGKDCFNNWYGDPDGWVGNVDAFQFDNAFWVYGQLLDGDDRLTKQGTAGRVTKSTLTEAFDLVLSKIVPYWEKNRISKVWGPGQEVYLQNELYRLDELAIENRLTTQAGRMFLFTVGLTRECTLNYQCTTLELPAKTIYVPPATSGLCIECIEITCVGP